MRCRLWSWLIVLAGWGCLLSCASAPPPSAPVEPPLYVNGVRQTPLTADEVGHDVNRRSEDFSRCYARERMNLDSGALSDFVFQLRVPNDGSKPDVKTSEASNPKQKLLESCLATVLGSLRFPAHVGQPVTINVPIKAPR